MQVFNEEAVKNAVIECVLKRYTDVPAEKEVNYTFFKKFEQWAKKLVEKTKERRYEAPLRFSKKAIKIIALVAALIALLATTAMAVPTIREAIIGFFFYNRGESYGVTFDPEQVATAPDAIETVIIPTTIPAGFGVLLDDRTEAGVIIMWKNANGEYIFYSQSPVAKDASNDNWFGTDSERSTHTSCIIQGYKVEKLQNDEVYSVFWTDNSYFYWIEFSNTIDFSVFEAMLASMTPVE